VEVYHSKHFNCHAVEGFVLFYVAALVLTGLLMVMQPAQSIDLPCFYRPTSVNIPWLSLAIPCLERVLPASEQPAPLFSLTISDDGTVFAARPAAQEVIALVDADGDGLADTERTVVRDISTRHIAWYDGSLFGFNEGRLVRMTNGAMSVLNRGITAGRVGGIAVGLLADDTTARIWVALGASCLSCTDPLSARGGIISFALDGSDGQTVAVGLFAPGGLVIQDGALYVTDSAPHQYTGQGDYDELNRVAPGDDLGFPACLGMNTETAADGCVGTVPPIAVFAAGSRPQGFDLYGHRFEIGTLADRAIIAQAGVVSGLNVLGFSLDAVSVVDAAAAPLRLLPFIDSPQAEWQTSSSGLNWRGVGLFPQRPLSVAVNDDGWVYFSLQDGSVYVMRPVPQA
jgi:glucose/arabinose dehydrogenase